MLRIMSTLFLCLLLSGQVLAYELEQPTSPNTLFPTCLHLSIPVASQFIGIKDNPDNYNSILIGWDTNGDNEVDYIEFYEWYGATDPRLKPFPYKVAFSQYGDNRIDHVFMDVNGNGVCADLRDIGAVQPKQVSYH